MVTHSAVDYTLDFASIVLPRYENGFDTAVVLLEDTQARNYLDKADAGDIVKISQKDRGDAAWTELLDGTIQRTVPIIAVDGNYLRLECDGAGAGVAAMLCGEEYGSESSNPTLDTIKEVVDDNTNGIVDLWVNKLNGTATTTGYSYTTAIEAIAGIIKYLYFPYKPATKCLKDLCDVVQGIKGAAAGPHWIVDTSHRLLLTTVGAHSAAGDNPAQYWPTWWRTNQAGSTLVEGSNFINFQSYKLAKEANYILYHGRFRKPGDGDFWTESNAANWDTSVVNVAWQCTMSDEAGAGLFRVGSNSLEAYCDNVGTSFDWCWPSSKDSAWDLTRIGGKHNIPSISFSMRCDANVDRSGIYPSLILATYSEPGGVPVLDGWTVYLGSSMPTDDKWYHFNFPLGPYWKSAHKDFSGWTERNTGDWSDVDIVYFRANSKAGLRGKVYVDGLQFNGHVLRGARQAAAFTSAAPCRMKHVYDDLGKDDSLVASDDSGTMARLAYASLLQSITTPTVCTFTIPVAPDLLPGQLIHVHAKKKADGSFRIDADFRVTRLEHNFTNKGFVTIVDATSDVLNSDPRPLPMRINSFLAAARPEFQDRQASSIKARSLDITQPILEKSY